MNDSDFIFLSLHFVNSIECFSCKHMKRAFYNSAQFLCYFHSDANSAYQNKEGTLRKASSEMEHLRQQVDKLKRINDNALAENRFVYLLTLPNTQYIYHFVFILFQNSRLENELSEAESSRNETRSRLRACEEEVDRLKNQLQQYVHEVQKAENLLYRKVGALFYLKYIFYAFTYLAVYIDQEEEREEMLEHYKSLSQDAVALEGNNNSLEAEAADARYVHSIHTN